MSEGPRDTVWRVRVLVRIVGWLVTIASLLVLGWMLRRNWAEVAVLGSGSRGLVAIILAVPMAALVMCLSVPAWAGVVQWLGGPVLAWRTAWWWLAVSTLPKYLPGNVAHLGVRFAVGKRLGITTPALLRAIPLELALQVTAAATVLPLMAAALPQGFFLPGYGPAVAVRWLLAVLASAAVITGGTLMARWICGRPSWPLLRPLVCTATQQLGQGVVAGCVVASLFGTWSPHLIALVIPAWIAAWLVGLLTPGAPAGLGTREAVFAGILTMRLSMTDAALAAVACRLIALGADALFALGGYLAGRHQARERQESVTV